MLDTFNLLHVLDHVHTAIDQNLRLGVIPSVLLFMVVILVEMLHTSLILLPVISNGHYLQQCD